VSEILKVDMVPRIEGHQEIDTEKENGVVVKAKVKGTMARGFEKFLQGRAWMDAVIATSRVCGVCWHVHGEAAAKAMEKIASISPPLAGRVTRETTLAIHMAVDHVLHFYQLCGPDWINILKAAKYAGKSSQVRSVLKAATNRQFDLIKHGYPPGKYVEDAKTCEIILENYLRAFTENNKMLSRLVTLGSKYPHPHSVTPAGVTTEITAGNLLGVLSQLKRFEDFVMNSMLPDALAVAKAFPEHFELGNSGGNFLALDTCWKPDGTSLFKSGIVLGNERREAFDQQKVHERTDNSWYKEGSKTEYDFGKKDAYTFVKEARYAGQPMEVGPLARLVVSKNKRLYGFAKSQGLQVKSSNLWRIVARVLETIELIEYAKTNLDWLITHPNEPTIIPWNANAKVSGEGWGHSIAGRGDLMHYYEVVNGKIQIADLIVPSTWNFSPNGGPAEKAMLGLPVKYKGEETIIELLRTSHSFDPCMACSIH